MNLFNKPMARVQNMKKHTRTKDFVFSSFSLLLLIVFAVAGILINKAFGLHLPLLQIPAIVSMAVFSGLLLLLLPFWIILIFLLLGVWVFYLQAPAMFPLAYAVFMFLGYLFSSALQYVQHWDQVIILRAGKFNRVRGAGIFFLMPIFDRITAFVDTRIRAADFTVEKTLTGDTVPVDVDALAFWMVWDAKQAILEVENFMEAVSLSAQTALRDAIGKNNLTTLLSDREKLGKEIQKILDAKTNAWGITILSVEITDIIIPADLENAMSKQAQAEREKAARVILGSAEVEIAEKFEKASFLYKDNPAALQLRAMNMVYEGIRDKGSLMILPSSALDSMNLGTVMGSAALHQNYQKDGLVNENNNKDESKKSETQETAE